MSEFRSHEIEWTPEKAKRLWAHYSIGAPPQIYFGYHSGESILDAIEKRASLTGRVLDFGCGPGHLIRHLLNRGINCEGLDFSPESVGRVNEEFGQHPLFQGATLAKGLPVPVSEGSIDVALLVEVVEHVPDGALQETLSEVRRILRPGGKVVVTTPNDENLHLNKVMCPECGCVFHCWQHVRTFDERSLASVMESAGFETLECCPVTFAPRRRLDWLRRIARRILADVQNTSPPHLFYVGLKPPKTNRVPW